MIDSSENIDSYVHRIISETSSAMTNYISPFCTALPYLNAEGDFFAGGSGTYIQGDSGAWILTNEHVVRELNNNLLIAHLPTDGGQYSTALSLGKVAKHPIDAATLLLDSSLIKGVPPRSRLLNPSFFDNKFDPAEEEMLFIYGFPGSTSERNDPIQQHTLRKAAFGHLYLPGAPLLTSVSKKLVSDKHYFDEKYHFRVDYPIKVVKSQSKTQEEVSQFNPKGISGTAIWDTKRCYCLDNGIEWHPSMARICGLIWGAENYPEVLIATKIEHVLQLI